MNENKMPHNFENCITEKPDSMNDDMVIHPLETETNDKIQFSENIIPYGYLNAAELLFEGLHKKQYLDDKLALPLLNLYVCTLEFCLKLLLKKLKEHGECNSCHLIKKIGNNNYLHHDLNELCEDLKEILPDKGKLHHLNDFNEISEFIKKLHKSGIDLVSVRYVYDKKGKILPLHQKKTFIKTRNMHENIKYISEKILSYISDRDFELCEFGTFSQNTLNELKYVKSIMNKYCNESLEYKKNINNINDKTTDINGFITVNLENLFIHDEYEEKLFKNSLLSKLEHKELAALVMGLYFYDPNNFGVWIDVLSNYEAWSNENLERKLKGRIQNFENAYRNLIDMITHIDKTLTTRM